MKKSILLAAGLVMIMWTSMLAEAKTITVDNRPHSIGDYSTLSEAQDAANNDDIIYVMPSGAPYAGITVRKRLIFYGVGFDLLKNPGQSPFLTQTSKISGTMTFSADAQGAILEGFDGRFYVLIQGSNISIKRNRLSGLYFNTYSVSGISVLQNDFRYDNGSAITIGTNGIEAYFYNNIIVGSYALYFSAQSNHYLVFVNNVLKGNIYSNHSGAKNLVMVNCASIGCTLTYISDPIFQYNITDGNWLPNADGNINGAVMSSVFVDPANNDFHLQPGSPAAGTGKDGVDMGIYGGPTPFVDSGMPGLATIYYLESPLVASQTSGLEVTIKANSNKE